MVADEDIVLPASLAR